MASISRRNLLRCGAAVWVGLAGCTSLPGNDESPDQNTETASSGRTSAGNSSERATTEDLRPGATVVTQPSEESPAEIELTLSHTHGDSISVSPVSLGTYAFELLRPLRGEHGDVLLYPDSPRVSLAQGEFPDEPSNGCWRVIDTSDEGERGPYLRGQNLAKPKDIAPDETHSVRHEAYYRGPDSHCFPADTYETTTEIEFSDREQRVELTYTLDVSTDGEFEMSVEHELWDNSN